MSLLVDTFSTEVAFLEAQGWSLLRWNRYDPTYAIGITPTGKAVELEVVNGTCTITIAGNVRSLTEPLREDWEPADKTRDLIERTYRRFPGNQR